MTTTALFDRSSTARLELRGADRQRFLNGLVTCDTKTLTPGHGAYGFFTDGKGRVLADVVVLALEDRLWLELPAGQGDAIASHLQKYIIADRVDVGALDGWLPISLLGELPDGLFGLDAAPAVPYENLSLTAAGFAVHAVREGRQGLDALSLWVPQEGAEAVAQALLAMPGVKAIGEQDVEVRRVAAGVGKWGQDFGPEHFPQETGAEAEAVSYTKGCYLGQEIVARIHYRGGVQRALRGLRFADAANSHLPALGTAIMADGRESGRLTSVARSAMWGTIGLAVLHQRVGEDGATVELETGETATLAALPFGRP
ncbi:MAG: hypothetical protein ABI609_03045 [Acidobacteriota bacterium]